ncbi:hypothetical protein G6F57_015069 [Rhizopus arrhizus]|nr:hypothetical protein G6F57_015069 [Rhizopus arrhizus]
MADESVLQVHAVLNPTQGLFDAKRAHAWLNAFADRTQKPWRVAVPTYGSRVGWDEDGNVAAIESERPALQPGGRATELVVTPAAMAAFVDQIHQSRPRGLAGIVWFRLPTARDERAWSLATWRAVLLRQALQPKLHVGAQAIADGGGTQDLVLSNTGNADGALPFIVRWNGVCRGADGINGYTLERDGAGRYLRRAQDGKGGPGFAFVINGVPIFAKGANVIPFDAFPARVDAARLRQVLTAARDANMNMLRNWGGGYYEDDAFFDIADELGLLVWQDFMFGGGMQPGYDPAFRASVVAEARDNVRRLRHHPSIVLWCGNNEEETAWKDWGHGRDLKAADPAFAAKVWQGYVDLFGNDLRQVVGEEGLGVPYWSSSPSNDLDEKANDSTRGDKHYWQVWGNPALPVQAYLRETPRFMSESPPAPSSASTAR